MNFPPSTLLVVAAAGCATIPESTPVLATDRPSFSDSTGLVPAGRPQLETGYTFTHRSDAGVALDRHAGPEVLARYRVLDRCEARLLWGGWLFEDGGTDAASDVGVGFKVPIADQSGLLPTLAFGETLVLGSGGTWNPVQKLLWSYTIGDRWGLGGNLVLGLPEADGERYDQSAVSVYGTWAPRFGTTVFAEYWFVSPYAKATEMAHNVDFGVLHLLSPNVQVDARVGFGLGDQADDLVAGVGISFLF